MNYFIKEENNIYCIYKGDKLVFKLKHEDIARVVLSLLQRDERIA